MNLKWNALLSIIVVLILTACGGSGDNQDSKPVLVVPANRAPIANAGEDFSVSLGDVVTLDGSASSDPDGDSLSYTWKLLNGPDADISFINSVAPTFTPQKAGEYEISLTVSDGKAASDQDTVVVSVVKPNTAPFAIISGQLSGIQGLPISLTGEQSGDADGDNLAYKWSFLSVPEGSSMGSNSLTQDKQTSFVPDAAGSYTLQLIVNDGNLDSLPVKEEIKVDPNIPPSVTAVINIAFPLGGEAYIYSDVFDPDSSDFSYSWEITSAPEGSDLIGFTYNKPYLTYVPDLPGEYTARVTVNDGVSSVTSDEVVAEIKDVEYGYSLGGVTQYYGKINQSILIDFSTSNSPEGKKLEYSWVLRSGPSGSRPSLTKSIINSAETKFSGDKPGTYRIDVTLKNNDNFQLTKPYYITLYNEQTNLIPTASSKNHHVISLGEDITLDGRSSFDFEGDILSYQWAIVYQPPGSALQIENSNEITQSFQPQVPGFYNIHLRVKDKNSPNESISVAWFYVYEKEARTIAFTDKSVFAKTGSTITLDGSRSTGIDDSVTVSWDLLNAPYNSISEINNLNTLTPTFQIDAVGKFVFQLRLMKGSDVVSIEHLTVRGVDNSVPVANAGEDFTITSRQNAEFSATDSFDAENDPLAFIWEVVGVSSNTTAIPYFQANDVEKPTLILADDFVGQVVIGLTVSDGEQKSVRDEVILTVVEPQP